jgi:flagellar basal-body rod protein FlgB
MSLLSNALGVHEEALGLRAKRMEVLAKNIANADTPHYKAQDVDFKTLLDKAHAETRMNATHTGHYDLGDVSGEPGMKYRVPLNPSFDGNTVEINVEQAQYGKAAADYQATLSFLENRVSSVRRALRGE